MTRSAESAAREAVRSRSVRKFSSWKGTTADCTTGHPAMFAMAPALEYRRMPEGGGYPLGFVEDVARLMGCQDLGAMVHLCSGSLGAPRSFDLRGECAPAVVADVRRLPVRSCSVDFVMIDPPYGPEYAETLWGLGKFYPTPMVLLRETERILRRRGQGALLHHLVPRLPDGLERVGTWGVSCGPGLRIRALSIVRKAGAEPLSGPGAQA